MYYIMIIPYYDLDVIIINYLYELYINKSSLLIMVMDTNYLF